MLIKINYQYQYHKLVPLSLAAADIEDVIKKNSCFVVFRGQMISQEDYNFIYQFDNANSETKSAMLKEAGPQVTEEISPLNLVFQFLCFNS